jgi:hypothetical protein
MGGVEVARATNVVQVERANDAPAAQTTRHATLGTHATARRYPFAGYPGGVIDPDPHRFIVAPPRH